MLLLTVEPLVHLPFTCTIMFRVKFFTDYRIVIKTLNAVFKIFARCFCGARLKAPYYCNENVQIHWHLPTVHKPVNTEYEQNSIKFSGASKNT